MSETAPPSSPPCPASRIRLAWLFTKEEDDAILSILPMHKRSDQFSKNNTVTIDVYKRQGMNRTGLVARKDRYDQAVAEAKEIFALPNLSVTGIYTHFSCGDSEDPEDIVFTQNQYDVFCEMCIRDRFCWLPYC